MKLVLFLSAILIINLCSAQNNLPVFLSGTWHPLNQKLYEHWDVISPTLMKGYSYEMQGTEMVMKEYLEISKKGKATYYTATVIGQNDGEPVQFKMTRSDSVYVFENAKHDFPNRISYKQVSANQITIDVSDFNGEGFTCKMTNVDPEDLEKVASRIKNSGTGNPNYDADLAEKTGADDYGMKNYVFVILKTGPNTTTDKKYIDSCFAGHMSNMGTLVQNNQLVVAGPFGKNIKTYRGLFILNVDTTEEAESILATDPAVSAGLLAYEVYNWYGSAALPEYLEASDKIWKKKF